jgi:hypothetical protein
MDSNSGRPLDGPAEWMKDNDGYRENAIRYLYFYRSSTARFKIKRWKAKDKYPFQQNCKTAESHTKAQRGKQFYFK